MADPLSRCKPCRMTVTDPSGTTWRVSRRWVPWRRRLRDHDLPYRTPSLDAVGDDPVSMVLGLVALVLVLPLVMISLLVALELLLLLLLLPLAVLARVVLGRHWRVEVRRGWTHVWEAPAGDWRASEQKIQEIADAITRGDLPPVAQPPVA